MFRFLSPLSVLALVFAFTVTASAHEIDPAVADIDVREQQVDLSLQLSLESFIMELDLSTISNTTQALPDEEEAYMVLRELSPADLGAALDERWPVLAPGLILRSGESEPAFELVGFEIPEVGDTEVQRVSTLQLRADLPEGDAPVQFGWIARNGDLVVRQVGGGAEAYTAFLQDGVLSEPLPRMETLNEGAWDVFTRYIPVGFEHIVPLGVDHILFVLGLFFFALKARAVLLQVTAFTVAHTITLALASLNIVSVPGSVVEPLIAASIVYVGIENIWGRGSETARTALVFAFGLLHGLGFASVLGDFGITASHFAAALVGFNIGVELGQLAVIAVAFVLIVVANRLTPFAVRSDEEAPVQALPVTYRAVAVVGSLTISLIGAWWTFERVFL